MSDERKELDISGLGRIAEAIPEEGWRKAIDTACDTFSDLIAPVTKTTAGLGGLIQAKFDAMIDVQKVFAADAVHRARVKTVHNRQPQGKPKARVLVSAIEQASIESDENLRDIWANLIGNEMLYGNVHPEFPQILSRLAPRDAAVLSEVAQKSEVKSISGHAILLAKSVNMYGISIGDILGEDEDASHEHLDRLFLIRRRGGAWQLTRFGEEFLSAVSLPDREAD